MPTLKNRRPPRPRALIVLLAATLPAAAAEPSPQTPRFALVIANDAYRALPPIPACQASASLLTATLRRAGWTVTELRDPSNGQMGAAIGTFGDTLAEPSAPAAVALVYECGYAATYERRLFLLPTSASLARDTDVLTAGLVAPALIGPVARSKIQAGLVALDLIPLPTAVKPTPDTAQLRTPAPRTGLVVAANPAPGPAAPTPLAIALAAALSAPTVQDLQAQLVQALAAKPGLDLFTQPPAEPAPLQTAPTPAAPLQAAPLQAAPLQAEPPPTAEPAQTATTPPTTSPTAPDDIALLGDLDRRRVQLALQRLGYYTGKIDGTVGPETLAAIRRYQHELATEMTGRLTQSQAARLLAQP